MIAGAWVLVLVPLIDALYALGWASHVPVPNIVGYGAVCTLDETFVGNGVVFEPLVFCIGIVLLFSKERGRRRARLDWTRRWGVLCSYVVLIISAAQILFLPALVLVGITACFLSMPLKYQPALTGFFAKVSAGWIRYGPQPKAISGVVLVAFSSIAILLACIALFDGLRSSGSKRAAAILLAPLALFALIHLAQAGRYCVGAAIAPSDVFRYRVYFSPVVLRDLSAKASVSGGLLFVEAAKWCAVLGIAFWLSIAQLAGWWQGKKTRAT
jgi:hypothetical protein